MRHRTRILLITATLSLYYVMGLCAAQSIVVTGIGYPPIKAASRAQALTMARRAAVMDAYSKVLWRQSTVPESVREETYYLHFSGFIRGMQIEEETLLPDGGIQVRVSSPLPVTAEGKNSPVKLKREKIKRKISQTTPQPVSLDEWFEIITGIVDTSGN